MNKVTIFTDGASRGNPGPGGWGSVIIVENEVKKTVTELGGGEKLTTNNRMELMAAIGGVSFAKKHSLSNSEFIVYTDSSYVINGITKWVHGWKRNGWMTKTKAEVLNKDLWTRLSEASDGLKVTWKYVGGHIGILGNERCDQIATAFADGKQVKLFSGSLLDYDIPKILDVSHDQALSSSKKSNSSHSKAKAYSYVSMINGQVQTHSSWAECEKRVKGAKGARYKKSLSEQDEADIIREFKGK